MAYQVNSVVNLNISSILREGQTYQFVKVGNSIQGRITQVYSGAYDVVLSQTIVDSAGNIYTSLRIQEEHITGYSTTAFRS